MGRILALDPWRIHAPQVIHVNCLPVGMKVIRLAMALSAGANGCILVV